MPCLCLAKHVVIRLIALKRVFAFYTGSRARFLSVWGLSKVFIGLTVSCFLFVIFGPPLSVFGSLFIPFFGFLAFVIDVITFYYFWTSWNLLCLLIVDFSVFIVSVLKLNL